MWYMRSRRHSIRMVSIRDLLTSNDRTWELFITTSYFPESLSSHRPPRKWLPGMTHIRVNSVVWRLGTFVITNQYSGISEALEPGMAVLRHALFFSAAELWMASYTFVYLHFISTLHIEILQLLWLPPNKQMCPCVFYMGKSCNWWPNEEMSRGTRYTFICATFRIRRKRQRMGYICACFPFTKSYILLIPSISNAYV